MHRLAGKGSSLRRSERSYESAGKSASSSFILRPDQWKTSKLAHLLTHIHTYRHITYLLSMRNWQRKGLKIPGSERNIPVQFRSRAPSISPPFEGLHCSFGIPELPHRPGDFRAVRVLFGAILLARQSLITLLSST